MDQADLTAKIPTRIEGLHRLAYNLWWSWHPAARELFRVLDLQAWHDSEHNPLLMLRLLAPETLARAAEDRDFLARYDGVMSAFEAEVGSADGWFSAHWGRPAAPLAYLSAEYGLHSSLRLYAGGLGVLAGDHLKECSDLAAPVVGVGLIYARGYVWQRIRENGWQDDVEQALDRTDDPVAPVCDEDGNPVTVRVPVFDPPVDVRVWKVLVGRVALYLLDPDLEGNQPWDRQIAHRLYASDLEQRLRQEIVLGMGGMQALKALGFRPAAVHLNEGHPAFSVLERVRDLTQEGVGFEEALERVRRTTIFTTHTPVSAGTDVFPFPLLQKYFAHYAGELGTNWDRLLQLGVNPADPQAGFNMTVFALRASRYANAVSERHGEVARRMWAGLWPETSEGAPPIAAITNGVHLRTWIEPRRLQDLLSRTLGPSWIEHQDQPGIWERVDAIPDDELWAFHENRKASLITMINERSRARWSRDKAAINVIALGALLDPRVLTIGFARRFTSYKRPDLILRDLERVKRLLTDERRPVQLIFAGKAHPADLDGKRLIQKVVQLAQNPEYAGRIAFVENYDHNLAHYLVAGVDVWLNNPIPPMEASGTSGMKACINGVPQLSISDGWWAEGYNGANGWRFGEQAGEGDRSPADAEAVYRLLEEEIVPLYYRRDEDGIPHAFVQVMKTAIKSVAPRFSTRRMVKEYVERFYLPALGIAHDEEAANESGA